MKKPQLHTSEAVAFVLRLAVSETLSATPLLVSLTQGDNSLYIAPLALGELSRGD